MWCICNSSTPTPRRGAEIGAVRNKEGQVARNKLPKGKTISKTLSHQDGRSRTPKTLSSDLHIYMHWSTLPSVGTYTHTSILTMGKAIKMPFQSIARYEKGKTEPSISNAYKIASYFFMSLEDFIFQNDVIALFEINVKKLCVFAPTQNIPICKERFPNLNIKY